jgi:two-component system, NarL family, invasion response regulator UvrY
MNENETSAISIAIVDDHALFRQGLIALIERYNEDHRYKILFEAENGLDMSKKIKPDHKPDIVLMDISMPQMDGFDSVIWLNNNYPEINVIAMTMLEDTESVLRMMKLGVKAYLSKAMHVGEVQNALECVRQNKIFFSDFVSSKLLERHKTVEDNYRVAGKRQINKLTENEKIFLELACSELSYFEIAKKMNLSPKTIDGYRHALFDRFDVSSRVGLVLHAVKYGLVKMK